MNVQDVFMYVCMFCVFWNTTNKLYFLNALIFNRGFDNQTVLFYIFYNLNIYI